MLGHFGIILLIHHDSRVRESQWGRYNFPRYIPIVRIVDGEIPLDPIKSPLNHN